jgi:hypothetical protein
LNPAARIGSCVLTVGIAAALPVFAAHPLQTEDTGTQGRGNIEIENGLSWTRAGGATLFVYQPQLSYGLTPTCDLIVQPAWLRAAESRGWGDTNLDAKARFYGEAPWSLGVRAGATLATSQRSLGLRHGDASAHAVLVASYAAAPVTMHANLGLAVNPASSGGRRVDRRMSAAIMWAASERLTWTVDVGAGSDPDPARSAWPATLLAGVIYTIRPGLDVDLGYQTSSGARPATRQWLTGLTYRFSL